MKITAITKGLANSRKYSSTSTVAAIMGRAKRSFVLGFNQASAAPQTTQFAATASR